jgi:predicted outer membrane repeat protein
MKIMKRDKGDPEHNMSLARSIDVLSFSILAVLLIVLLSFNAASAATTWTVTSTADTNTPGTLRYAIDNANSGDTIVFNLSGCPCTIYLNSLLPNISKDLTITGPGATSLTIDGNSNQVLGITSGTVKISGLTISNANSQGGSAIFNSGTLTVTDCAFSGNSAGADGGAIDNGGTLTVTNCTFNGNTAGGNADGGAIYNDGTLTVTNSTFSGNSAGHEGGAIENEDTLTVTNSTFSGNSAGDGGGIYNDGESASLRNTIMANNTSGGNCGGTITDLGHNLEYNPDNTCGFSLASNDITGQDPLLGPLALNAPGTTKTFALLPGSPAIDKADPGNFPSTDQRGVARPQGAGPDIGAYEYFSTPIPTLTEWGMIIFMLLAGLGAVYYLRKQRRRVKS